MKTIAIIGGGFCGTIAAVNLARLAKGPLRVVIINAGSPPGRGVAYGTKQAEHLLNVAARNMSAFPDQPDHFFQWLKTRSEYADVPDPELRERFVPRKTYGDYLQGLLFWHTQGNVDPKVQIELVHGEVLGVVPAQDRAAVLVDDNRTIEADKVLLATGNPPPAVMSASKEFTHPRLLNDPWKLTDFGQADPSQTVVLVGAGLTMIDVFLTLSSLGWRGKIIAASRTGLLPPSHFQGVAYPDFPPTDPTGLGLDALVALVEEHCGRLRGRGENPAIVIDRLRPFTQRIWQNLSTADKQRFQRDYRTRWNVFRHRVARSIHDQLTSALSTGALEVIRGTIRQFADAGDQIRLTVSSRADQGTTTIDAGWVINCTGPRESYRGATPLYENLFDRGLIQADDMDMGIKVGTDFAVKSRNGTDSTFLFAIGPMLKGSLWETTAVPELRVQSLRVVETMLAQLEGGSAPGWSAEQGVDVIEYVI